MKTRTGNFPIGLIRGGLGREMQDSGAVIAWMKENELEVIDGIAPEEVKTYQSAGIRIGNIGLKRSRDLMSPDKAKRDDAVADVTEYIKANAAIGPLNYMVVMAPEDPAKPRAENFGYMVESYGALVPALETGKGRICIEGYPAPGALGCTPETLRALFKEIPSMSMGINYDPSHLIRMNIDYLRFLKEFGDRIVHLHGKDAVLLIENYYEYGTEQPATFARPVRFGAMHWRYAIPGHGIVRWVEVFSILKSVGYTGCVSIELEDANYTDTTEDRKVGILQGSRFLAEC